MLAEAVPLNYIEVSRSVLRSNAAAVCGYVGCPVIGVVKCDGYGVSIVEAARAWTDAGVKVLAVAEPQEAITLRNAGFSEDILLMAPVSDRETLLQMLDAGIILTVSSADCARFYAQNAAKRLRVHVAVDTGFGRFGLRWDDKKGLLDLYRQYSFEFEGIFSHFSASFESGSRSTKRQLSRFLRAVGYMQEEGIYVGIRHIANSCAALRFPETRLDAVRVGSALVGRVCADAPIALREAAVQKARVVEVKSFFPGDTVGYGSVCKVRRNTKALIAALGYEHGFGYVKRADNLPVRCKATWMLRAVLAGKQAVSAVYEGKTLPLLGRVGSQYSLFVTDGVCIEPGEYITVKAALMFPGQCRLYTE